LNREKKKGSTIFSRLHKLKFTLLCPNTSKYTAFLELSSYTAHALYGAIKYIQAGFFKMGNVGDGLLRRNRLVHWEVRSILPAPAGAPEKLFRQVTRTGIEQTPLALEPHRSSLNTSSIKSLREHSRPVIPSQLHTR
jgi:hypothetical protein